MATSEIEKLERRYAENPSGLTFAPLAEVYRKNGDVPHALELLSAGIERHPEYIPARIVLGRCHLDVGDLTQAEQTFTHVLSLDGENVIALKALADISERQSRYDDAERWLHQLLAADRNNDTAQEQLARLETARRQVQLGSSAVPNDLPSGASDPDVAAEPIPDATPTAATDAFVSTLPSEPSIVEDPAALNVWASESAAAFDVEPAPLALDDNLAPPQGGVAPAEGWEPHEHPDPSSHADSVEALDGLVRPDTAKLRDELHNIDDDFQIETADELVLRPSSSSEFQMPDASQELIPASIESDPLMPVRSALEQSLMDEAKSAASTSVDAPTASVAFVPSDDHVPPSEPAGTGALEVEARLESETPLASEIPTGSESDTSATAYVASEAAAVARSAETPPDDLTLAEPALAEPPLIVTETMAEVLLQQGHTDDALRIYRALERRSGGDARIRAKRAELEAQTAARAQPAEQYDARDTGGQSVRAFFGELLAARLTANAPASTAASTIPASPPSTSTGAPTRPAADALSLSAVFGDESSPVPPAVPTAKSDVSFDEFFGAPGEGRSDKGARAPAPKEGDLDQFHSWLQNLKR